MSATNHQHPSQSSKNTIRLSFMLPSCYKDAVKLTYKLLNLCYNQLNKKVLLRKAPHRLMKQFTKLLKVGRVSCFFFYLNDEFNGFNNDQAEQKIS